MAETAIRIYRLTAAGTSALCSARSVPSWYREVLWLLQADRSSGEIVASLANHPGREVLDWLEQLDTLGFVESFESPAEQIPRGFVDTRGLAHRD